MSATVLPTTFYSSAFDLYLVQVLEQLDHRVLSVDIVHIHEHDQAYPRKHIKKNESPSTIKDGTIAHTPCCYRHKLSAVQPSSTGAGAER